MKSVNKVILIGNVGKDPEIVVSKVKIASFPLATTEKYKNKDGEMVESTEWHRIKAFGAIADTIEKYVTKGMPMYIEGRIRYGSYDKQDGSKAYTTDIIMDNMSMLPFKGNIVEENNSNVIEESVPKYPDRLPQESDDLPF